MKIDDVIEQMRRENYIFANKVDQEYREKMTIFNGKVKNIVYDEVSRRFTGIDEEKLSAFIDDYLYKEILANQKTNNDQLGYRLDEAILSFKRINENLRDTTRASSMLRMLINEEQGNINFDREHSFCEEFSNMLTRNILRNNKSRYVEEQAYELKRELDRILSREIDRVYEEYYVEFGRYKNKLQEKYDEIIKEYANSNKIKYDPSKKEVSSSDIIDYADSLGKLGYKIINEENEVYLENNNKEKIEVEFRDGVIVSKSNNIILKEVKDNVYGVYDAVNDVMCTVGEPDKSFIRFFHTKTNESITLEDTSLSYNFIINGSRAHTPEQTRKYIEQFRNIFPSVYNALYANDLVFKIQIDQYFKNTNKKEEVKEEVKELLSEVNEKTKENEIELSLEGNNEELTLDDEISMLENNEIVQRYLYLKGLKQQEIEADNQNKFL